MVDQGGRHWNTFSTEGQLPGEAEQPTEGAAAFVALLSFYAARAHLTAKVRALSDVSVGSYRLRFASTSLLRK